MKFVKNNKVYNTETSKNIGKNHFGYQGDLDYLHCDLYKSKKGTYFMIVQGGPNTEMRYETAQNEFRGSSQLSVLSAEEAMDWAEGNLNAEDYLNEFSEFVEEA